MIENINHIIEKYWAGETSLEEENILKGYLTSDKVKTEHLDMVPLFSFYKEQGSISGPVIDMSFLKTDSDMNSLVHKYWAGETTVAEEETLQAYLTSSEVATEHQDMIPLFSFFEEQEQVVMKKALDMSFLNEAQMPKSQIPASKRETKVRRLFPRVAAIAASLALLMMVTFSYMDEGQLANNHLAEVQDADEALELTMEALAFLGHNYDKGANPMKHIKQLEKTNVFSFN